ncbi:MAG: hypothetical protein Q9226_008831, partial [Calogaya cf. arnoldii]
RARLIARLLANGTFQESSRKGLATTPKEIAEAHCWLHKKSDGTIVVFEPVRHPWYHKDLSWIPEPDNGGTNQTIAKAPTGDWRVEIETAERDSENPEALRIFPQTLQRLLDPPTAEVETPIGQDARTETAETIADDSRTLRDVATQSNKEPHLPGDQSQNHATGYRNVLAESALAPEAHTRGDEDSDDPVVTFTRSLGRAEPAPKTEPNEDEDHTGSEASKAAQPAILTESNTDFYHSTEGSSRATLSNEARMMANPSFDASRQAHGLPSEMQIARQMSDQNTGLLEVSEDEDDEKPMKLEDIPWDQDSRYHPRFQQTDDAPSEGNSSDVQYMENITDDHSGGAEDGDQVGPAQLSGRFMSSSLDGEAGGRYTEDDYLDELQTEEEAGVNFAMPGNPNQERNAAYSFAIDRRSFGERHRSINTADSEAATEILDRNDVEMAGSGIGRYDEEDKENRPVRGTSEELFVTDEDERLEIRIIEDMDASSENELVGNNDNMAGY